MMNSGSSSNGDRAADLSNVPESDYDNWIQELFSAEFHPMMNFCLDDIMNLNLNDSQNNSGSIYGGGSADMGSMQSQSGIPQQMNTASSSTPNCSTSTLQTSGHNHILSPGPNFVSSPQTSKTTVLPQYTPQNQQYTTQNQQYTTQNQQYTTQNQQYTTQNQPLKQQVVVQNSPTYTTMSQPTTVYGQNNNNQQMTLDQLVPYQMPVSTIQNGHFQNHQRQHQMAQVQQYQNQTTMLQYQQPSGSGTSESPIMIPEDVQNRVHQHQGIVIGDQGKRKPQEQKPKSLSELLSVDVGFLKPSVFPSNEAWRDYAFRKIMKMRDMYLNELQKMQKKATHLCSQETNMEAIRKYDNAKEFLGRIITFLKISSVDMIPRNQDRVYNYMTFIVNYVQYFRSKNGNVNFDQLHLALHDTQSANLSQVVINLEANMVNFNQQPVYHHPSSSSQKGPQIHPNNGDIRSQQMPPPPQRIPNREANVTNFNQNSPSRRPQQGRMQNSYQMVGGTGNPQLRIGAHQPNVLGQTQRSNLGPKTNGSGGSSSSSTGVNNVSGSSSMSLLKAATTANFPPPRQLNHHQPSPVNVGQSYNSEKMKQPMYNSSGLTGSNMSNAMSPLSDIFQNQFPSPQKPVMLQQPSVSSWQVTNTNNVMSPLSMALSPFFYGSSSSSSSSSFAPVPSHHVPVSPYSSSSGLSSVSNAESQYLPEIPNIAGMFKDQRIMKNQVSDMGPPKTPTPSPMPTPSTEKIQESQASKDPIVRLMNAVKSSSSRTLGSSMNDIDSVQQDLDSIHDHWEPYTKPVDGDIGNINNFLKKCADMDQEGMFDDSMYDDNEPANLDHLDIGEETADLFTNGNYEPDRKMKRKLSATSASHSLPELSDYDLDQLLSEWAMDSTTMKKSKIESKNWAIMEELKEINNKLLETSLEIVVNTDEDSKGDEGIIVSCLYRNVCFPDLFHPQKGASSKLRPEFSVKLLVPVNYPESSPTILKASYCNVLSAPWPQLYEETVSKFNRAVRELPAMMSLGDMARDWDACARSVITEYVQKRGGKSFSIKYGSWESSSGSN